MAEMEVGLTGLRHESLIEVDYVDSGSPDHLVAEALNGLGLNLQISQEDLVRGGMIVERDGVWIRGTFPEVIAWEDLVSSPKTVIVRLAQAGHEIEDDLPHAQFDPETERRVRAYSLRWQGIRARRHAREMYAINNCDWTRSMIGVSDLSSHEFRLRTERDRRITESFELTRQARQILNGSKPLGRIDLIEIFQQEAQTLSSISSVVQK